MDLVNTFSNLQQAQTGQAIQMKVAQKVLDNQRQQGTAALQLLEAAALPAPGDALAAQATGLGAQLDIYA